MVDSKVIISMAIFIIVFYLFIGFATVTIGDDVTVDSNIQDAINNIPTNQSSLEDSFWVCETCKASSSGISTIWSIMTFKIFGLPTVIGLIVNSLIIGIFVFIVILEILKYIRGV